MRSNEHPDSEFLSLQLSRNYCRIVCLYSSPMSIKGGSIFRILQEGKPAWMVRTRNWKLRGGENRLSGLLEGVSIASLGKARRIE
ncbi:hypothetical protein V6N11_031771 [Hibiscus sabdariffa]|uniref:Uncharacterized protein n=1 Tax=Hibiscus sabdariffa TaxID=183260 RepID=A0ABR2SYU5_9ROSI